MPGLKLASSSSLSGDSTAESIPKSITIPQHQIPPSTTCSLDWADLPIIDLSKADIPEFRESLAEEVCQAMESHGFFYVINHGYTAQQTRRIFDLASATFDLVNEQEKAKYTGKSESVYEGYKPRQTWQIENGVSDQIEHYNMHRFVHCKQHPAILQPHLGEIEAFAKHNHMKILFTILRLLAIGLKVPEEAFIEKHSFEAPGESSVRFMKYYPRTLDEEIKAKNVWLKGHTDIGSITILWSQPISGLQILSPDKKWRYVKHIENALVINTGDVMQMLSGGVYKPTIHRVVQPPPDQSHLERVGVFYFAMAADNVKLNLVQCNENSESPLMGDWRKERTQKYGRTALKQSTEEKDVEEDTVCGVLVKEYN
ncbi:Clavaminate synthase-like protein [Dendrothele bispora CBS 962.96]|uniref:Clavaminate synthase-like protein n=1 Tax=Dendrothele bispora (strain CBS 962.96) TaxID=1314807 RepID=A0A4S8L2F6_DENBC|nr:Clavaminate synthase-like protein [Dendrothele bispora CBS 962.96]